MEEIILLFKTHLGIVVKKEQISYESIILGREELDSQLLPEKIERAELPEEVMTHVYQKDDDFVYVIEEIEATSKILIGIVKAGELVFWEEGNSL